MPVLKKHIENIRLLKSVAKKQYQKHFDEPEKHYKGVRDKIRHG